MRRPPARTERAPCAGTASGNGRGGVREDACGKRGNVKQREEVVRPRKSKVSGGTEGELIRKRKVK